MGDKLIVLYDERAVLDVDDASVVDTCRQRKDIQGIADMHGFSLYAVEYNAEGDELTNPIDVGLFSPK